MMSGLLSRCSTCERGNVAIMSAVIAPLMLGVLGLAVDYGALTLQKRRLQMAADMAALVAASAPGDAENAVKLYFADNGYDIAVKMDTDGNRVIDEKQIDLTSSGARRDGIALVSLGRYVPDAKVAVQDRFAVTAASPNAVRVAIVQKGDLTFASSFATPPILKVRGVAANRNEAAFSIGSRIASLNQGVVNGLLGALLGSSVKLDVMDYNALATAQVDLLQFSQALATQLKVQGVTYSSLLNTQASWPQFLAALIDTTPDTRTKAALRDFAVASAAKLSVLPAQAIDLGSYGEAMIEGVGLQSPHAEVKASVMDIVMAALTAANQNRQLNFDLDAAPLGLIGVKVRLAIGERMIAAPAVRFDRVGSIVRTAQTRLSIDIATPGLAKLLGMSVHVPIYIEAAYAEARMSDIACSLDGNRNGSVKLSVRPGVAELFIGTVDPARLADFSASPQVMRADLLMAPLVKATGYAHGALSNVGPSEVVFSSEDIRRGTVKTVATRNAVETLVDSALSDTDLNLSLVGLPLGSSTLFTDSLQQTLKSAAPIVDDVIANVSAILGLKIGEADVVVTDLSCNRAVLVQ